MVIVSQPESTSYTICICIQLHIYNIKPMPNQSGNGFSICSKDVMADKVVTGCWACGKHGFPGTLGGP